MPSTCEIPSGLNRLKRIHTRFQKLFLSNIESMKKIIQHQTLINPPSNQPINQHVLDIFKLKKLPKGIASNIITCTPYIYCQTNSKPIRNSDIFFERSTSIFGTTTVILQIFNIFNCTKLDKLKTRFVKIIYNEISKIQIIIIGICIDVVSFY